MKDRIVSDLLLGGVDISLIEDRDLLLERIGATARKINEEVDRIYDIGSKDIDYVFRCYYRGRPGVGANYLNYIIAGGSHEIKKLPVETPQDSGNGIAKKLLKMLKKLSTNRLTKISMVKERGEITDITWKGDLYLAGSLNADNDLKLRIMERYQSNKSIVKPYLDYNSEHNLVVIHDPWTLNPEIEDFEIFDMIAGNIKSAWFGK